MLLFSVRMIPQILWVENELTFISDGCPEIVPLMGIGRK